MTNSTSRRMTKAIVSSIRDWESSGMMKCEYGTTLRNNGAILATLQIRTNIQRVSSGLVAMSRGIMRGASR